MSCRPTAFSLLMHRAAILDFKLKVNEDPLIFRDGGLTSGIVPDDIPDWELGNSDSCKLSYLLQLATILSSKLAIYAVLMLNVKLQVLGHWHCLLQGHPNYNMAHI